MKSLIKKIAAILMKRDGLTETEAVDFVTKVFQQIDSMFEAEQFHSAEEYFCEEFDLEADLFVEYVMTL